MFRFEKLEIWQLAIDYGNQLYDAADSLPRKETSGFGAQLRRAAVSISSNIAEGSGGTTTKDFKNYLDIAIKSILETASQLLFAKNRGYMIEKQRIRLYKDAEKLVRKINAFKKSLKWRVAGGALRVAMVRTTCNKAPI